MPSRDALSKCGGGLGRWSCSPTSRAWIESSMRFSVGLMKTGKTTPSNYLHRQLDVTPGMACICPAQKKGVNSLYQNFESRTAVPPRFPVVPAQPLAPLPDPQHGGGR